ncbi:MAG: AN1-type zinc finger domain-containing protein, partial [Thaumarchaeota archaeon]|nr:AN1-type zinc finger domain-containing protein [Nitrososphaerota archaeon]
MDASLSKSCKLCGYVYCLDHFSPQRHRCSMLENVEYVKADSFSNSTTAVPPNEIKTASPADAPYISMVTDMDKVEIPQTSNIGSNPYWLIDCLEDAKNVIIEFH